jgi:hypothetical protein
VPTGATVATANGGGSFSAPRALRRHAARRIAGSAAAHVVLHGERPRDPSNGESMTTSTRRQALTFVAAAGITGGGAFIPGCMTSMDGMDANGGVGQTANVPVPRTHIVFATMYSAFIPGDTLRTFSIPAVMSDGTTATWSLSDPTQAVLKVESFVAGGVTTPGVMITMKGTGGGAGPGSAGQVTVYATGSDGTRYSAPLNITQCTDDDWTIGSERYSRGLSLHLAPPGSEGPDSGYVQSDGGSFVVGQGGTPCNTCHSQMVKTGPYTDVAHTPEQAGGFSDTDLQDIIASGQVPGGGYFDPAVIDRSCTGAGTTLSPDMPACAGAAYATFQGFHKWPDIAFDQIPGMVCYLRSLTPEGQQGTSNFGGVANGVDSGSD